MNERQGGVRLRARGRGTYVLREEVSRVNRSREKEFKHASHVSFYYYSVRQFAGAMTGDDRQHQIKLDVGVVKCIQAERRQERRGEAEGGD